jgi:hypothetical protein
MEQSSSLADAVLETWERSAGYLLLWLQYVGMCQLLV